MACDATCTLNQRSHHCFQGSFLGKAQEAFGGLRFWLQQKFWAELDKRTGRGISLQSRQRTASPFLNVPPPAFAAPIPQSEHATYNFRGTNPPV